MLIRTLDIDEDTRKRMLLRDNEIFEIEELPMVEGGSGLRRFRIHQDDRNCGHVYEDQIDPEVLARL